MKRGCKHCGRHLVLIGTERKNGKPLSTGDGNDWEDRPYHKKCWNEIKQEEQFLERMRLLKERGERRRELLKQQLDLRSGQSDLPKSSGGVIGGRSPLLDASTQTD